MSSTYLRFVIAYVSLVALPLLGLFGVLRAGRDIAAPTAVDGAWNIQADVNQLAQLTCADSGSAVTPALTISQSGRYLSVRFNSIPGLTASGTLEGNTIQIVGSVTRPGSRCESRSVSLVAALDPGPGATSLRGKISAEGCPLCPPLDFRAMREPLL